MFVFSGDDDTDDDAVLPLFPDHSGENYIN